MVYFNNYKRHTIFLITCLILQIPALRSYQIVQVRMSMCIGEDKVGQLKFGRPTEKPSNADINQYRSILNMIFMVLSIIQFLLSAINVFIHGFGFYLLISLYKDGQQNVPACITVYLSRSNGDAIFQKVYLTLYMINMTGIFYLYYLSMIYITLVLGCSRKWHSFDLIFHHVLFFYFVLDVYDLYN